MADCRAGRKYPQAQGGHRRGRLVLFAILHPAAALPSLILRLDSLFRCPPNPLLRKPDTSCRRFDFERGIVCPWFPGVNCAFQFANGRSSHTNRIHTVKGGDATLAFSHAHRQPRTGPRDHNLGTFFPNECFHTLSTHTPSSLHLAKLICAVHAPLVSAGSVATSVSPS